MRSLMRWFARSLCPLVVASTLATAALAQVPAVVMSNHQTLYSNLTNGTQRVSANARGDVFFHDPPNHQLLELPAGSTTPVVLLKNTNSATSSSGPSSVDVDSAGNVYFNNTYGGRIIRIPYNSGSYPTNIDASDATLKVTTCTPGMAVDCVLPTLGTIAGGYSQTSDSTMDAAGNIYMVDVNDSITNGKYNRIAKIAASGTQSILVDNLTSASNAQIVSDAAGNLFYADGTALYSLPVGATTLTQVNASTLSKPTGVTFDFHGNLIVTDSGNSRIVVIPLENGALNDTDQYLLAPYYSQNSVGIDSFGTIYYSGSSGGASSISALQSSVYQAAPLAVGSNTASALVYASFNASLTFSSIYTHANGGTVTASVNTCVLGTTYTAGKNCSLNTQVKPTRVGPVTGILGVADASGTVQGQFAFTITGQGSAVAIDPGTSTSLGSSFTSPSGVAVDRAGNIFVADSSANTVYELAGGTGTPVAVGSGLNKPTNVAVDAAGDLFIADTGNARVVEITNEGAALQTSEQTTIASSLEAPFVIAAGPLDALYIAQPGQLARYAVRGVPPAVLTTVLSTAYAKPSALALDPSGNLFLADQATGDLVELAAYTGTASKVASGLTAPTGLATDAAGDLFLIDNGTAQAVRIPIDGGTLNYANAVTLGEFTSPVGIALDSMGNAYVTDASTPALYEVSRTLGSLNFGAVNQNTTSPALSATLVSSGNQALTLGSPLYTASGDTTHFAVTSGTCTAGASIAAGSGCTIAATFTPTSKTTSTEVLALKASPTVATSPFQLTLTGVGTFLEPTTLAVTYSPSSLSYGQTATLTATLTPTAFNVAAATGTVTFYINNVAQKPVAIANNTVSIQTSSLTGGTSTVYAIYSGDINYAASTASTVAIDVAPATTTTTLTIDAAFSSPTSNPTGNSLTLTAVVTPSVAGVVSGTVSFMSGSTTLGTADVTATPSGAYQAKLTTGSIPSGSYNVTAVYPGNTNYGGSTSAAQTLIVSSAGIQLTSSNSAITSSPTLPGSVTLSVASISGLGSPTAVPVTFACSGLPANAVCYFSPAYISLSASPSTAPIAPTAVGLTIKVGVSPGQPMPIVSTLRAPGKGSILFAGGLAAPLLMLLYRRRQRAGLLATASLVLLCILIGLSLTGCSSGSSPAVTPAGTYPITVTATCATSTTTATTSTTLNLTVNN